MRRLYIPVAAYLFSCGYLAFYSHQTDLVSILIPVLVSFVSLIQLLRSSIKEEKWLPVVATIALAKCLFLFSSPQLSNDFYRYWWDGYLSTNGLNPYAYKPSEIINQFNNSSFTAPLIQNFNYLNSKEYYSIYPLLSQLVFFVAAFIAGSKLYLFSWIVKLIYLLIDFLCLKSLLHLLDMYHKPQYYALMYFGSPLILTELHGNLHVEQLMISFLILSLYYQHANKAMLAGATLGMSILSKLNALLIAPFLIFRVKKFSWNLNWFLSCITACLPFLFILLYSFANYQGSLKLYFGQFEFNSFIYRPVRDFLFDKGHYTLKADAALICIIPFILLYITLWYRAMLTCPGKIPFREIWLSLFAFLMFSSTVHPWYLTTILFVGLFCFPMTSLVWSLLVFLSYAFYDPHFAMYNQQFICMEYTVVLIALFIEYNRPKIIEKIIGPDKKQVSSI